MVNDYKNANVDIMLYGYLLCMYRQTNSMLKVGLTMLTQLTKGGVN